MSTEGASRRNFLGAAAAATSVAVTKPANADELGAKVTTRLDTLERLLVGPPAVDPDRRSLPRPLLYGVEQKRPAVMQPYVGKAVDQVIRSEMAGGNCDFVVIGARRDSVVDGLLAARLVEQICAGSKRKVALALGAAPLLGTKSALAEFCAGSRGDADVEALSAALLSAGGPEAAQAAVPLLEVAAARRLDLIGVGVDPEATGRVQRTKENFALAALTESERDAYLGGENLLNSFVNYSERTPQFDMYARRVVERRYDEVVPSAALATKDSSAPSKAAYFASFILADGAAASLAVSYKAAQKDKDNTLVVIVAPEEHVKYGLGLPGRLKSLGYSAKSVLLNPTPESTLSQTKQLRLELGVAEGAPIASDFVFFSEPPRPSTITHMMNPIDGVFKIDWGLSTGGGGSGGGKANNFE